MNLERVLEKLGVEPLERAGRRVWAERCPLPTHGHHNPGHRFKNFFVRVDEKAGLWHCYSCKAGGKLLELVVRIRGCSFDEAREWLSAAEEAAPEPYLQIRFAPTGATRLPFRLPVGVEIPPLVDWNSVPLAYARLRGVTDEQIRRWRIGYALEGRLEGRIVFPVYDGRGRLANYAARSFAGHEVRYLSASEGERPDKSALYGEHLWPAIEERRDLVVFEGAINGLAIERALEELPEKDRPFLAGMSGSALDASSGLKSPKLATFRQVLVATDPDKAGDLVAEKIGMAIGRYAKVRRVWYPDKGKDAAELSPAALLSAILAARAAA